MLLFSNFKSKERGLIALKIMSVFGASFGAFLNAHYLYARYMGERFGFELY
ncbi:hypothetical protein [Helicobacter pylori]|uniref:hypothetical protein n=1 Tax=Helicobacter pylori TaxID=210 RepID=UPI0018834BC4|nr:hypothetical protein [Helicobacter pylori]